MTNLPEITIHGRFQPPLHINHWKYAEQGFERAEHVTILITNPFQDEAFDAAASWRNDPENNPFSYDERVYMWGCFLTAMGIGPERYAVKPFNIKDTAAFAELDPKVPNLVNIYSEWSAKKEDTFKKHGLQVIALHQEKVRPVSGTLIRQIIKEHTGNEAELETKLVEAGFMAEAVPGLFTVLRQQQQG
jgi:nicotinamide mononucleotide adenylyltransferase